MKEEEAVITNFQSNPRVHFDKKQTGQQEFSLYLSDMAGIKFLHWTLPLDAQ